MAGTIIFRQASQHLLQIPIFDISDLRNLSIDIIVAMVNCILSLSLSVSGYTVSVQKDILKDIFLCNRSVYFRSSNHYKGLS